MRSWISESAYSCLSSMVFGWKTIWACDSLRTYIVFNIQQRFLYRYEHGSWNPWTVENLFNLRQYTPLTCYIQNSTSHLVGDGSVPSLWLTNYTNVWRNGVNLLTTASKYLRNRERIAVRVACFSHEWAKSRQWWNAPVCWVNISRSQLLSCTLRDRGMLSDSSPRSHSQQRFWKY